MHQLHFSSAVLRPSLARLQLTGRAARVLQPERSSTTSHLAMANTCGDGGEAARRYSSSGRAAAPVVASTRGVAGRDSGRPASLTTAIWQAPCWLSRSPSVVAAVAPASASSPVMQQMRVASAASDPTWHSRAQRAKGQHMQLLAD